MLIEKHNRQRHSLINVETDLKHDQGLVKELEEEIRVGEERE